MTTNAQRELADLMRWSTAVHEAGHFVIALLLTPQEKWILAGAVILDDGGGLTYTEKLGLVGMDSATCTAAGKLAERLASIAMPPTRMPPTGRVLERAVGAETASAVEGDFKEAVGVTDEIALAQYCAVEHPGEPEKWYAIYLRVRLYANVLINEHPLKIIAAADLLYTRSVITTQEAPAVMGRQSGLPASRLIHKSPPADAGKPQPPAETG